MVVIRKTFSGPSSIQRLTPLDFATHGKTNLKIAWQNCHSSIAIHREEARPLPNKLSETDACDLIQVLMAHALRVFAEFLGGQFKSGQLGSDQNRPTEVARNQ